jgi:hypothetical protein
MVPLAHMSRITAASKATRRRSAQTRQFILMLVFGGINRFASFFKPSFHVAALANKSAVGVIWFAEMN